MKVAFVAAFTAVAGYGVYANQKMSIVSDLMLDDAEAMAECEIVRKGKAVLKCTGDGSCSKDYLGYTLICDGTKVN